MSIQIKRICSFVMALIMICSLIYVGPIEAAAVEEVSPVAETNGCPVHENCTAEWLDWPYAAGSYITEDGHYRLTKDITSFSSQYRIGTVDNADTTDVNEATVVDVVVDLAGHDITATSRIFYVNPSSTLTLLDSTSTPGTLTGSGTAIGGVLYVDAGKADARTTLNLYDITVTSTSTSTTNNGGAMYVSNNCDVNIHGATINGGHAKNGGAIAIGTDSTVNMDSGLISGGYADIGGNIYLGASTLNISGGTIQGGEAFKKASDTYGGGNIMMASSKSVVNLSGTGVITGGKDTASTSDGNRGGGNIFLQGTLNMTGGTISYGATNASGGNILVRGTFNMSGGSIYGGVAAAETTAKGGSNVGIREADSKVTITGGSITGGSVAVFRAADTHAYFKVSGNPVIEDLKIMNSGYTLTLGEGGLTEGAQIGYSKLADGVVFSAETDATVADYLIDRTAHDSYCPICKQEVTWSQWTSALTEGGHYYLAADVVSGGQWTVGQNVDPATYCLDLNGHSFLKHYGNYRAFNIYNGSTANVFNTSEFESQVIGTYIAADAGVINLDSASNLNLYDGITIIGKAFNDGMAANTAGAIQVNSGTLNMYGGTIIGQTVEQGGAILVEKNGTFNMHGGVIEGGKAVMGGAVYVKGAFNMYGGTIKNGQTLSGATNYYGGNLYIAGENAVAVINDGTIENGWAYANGGNIFVTGGGSLTINGGNIYYGKSAYTGEKNLNNNYGGGNIYVNTNGSLTINDGSILGGSSLHVGGNIYVRGNTTINGGMITAGSARDGIGNDIAVRKTTTTTVDNETVTLEIDLVINGGWIQQISAIRDGANLTLSGNIVIDELNLCDHVNAGVAPITLKLGEGGITGGTIGIKSVEGPLTEAHEYAGASSACFQVLSDCLNVGITDQILLIANHSWVDYAEVAPTCHTDGNIAYQQCSVCGAAQTAGENPMPLAKDGWVLAAAHTALEHHDAVEATCDQDGHEAFDYCSACEVFIYEDPLKLSYQDGIILATGHAWTEYEAVEPSCNAEGNIAYALCSNCGAAQTVGENPMPLTKYGWILAATGEHTLEHHDAVEATCDTDGHEAFDYCTSCECFFYEDPLKLTYQAGIILATGHTWVEYEAVEPTCDLPGNIAYQQCSVCGAAQTAGENPMPLAKDGWVLGPVHAVEHVEAKAATVGATGNVEYWFCSICGSAWLDENQTQVTNLLSVITPALEASQLTTNIGELSFVAGEPMEFEFSTIANGHAGVLVIGTSNFSDPEAIEKLEYYEVSNGQWYELTGDFGPASGFPMSDATSLFRVTFAKGGEYTFTASMKDAASGEILCSVEATAVVHEHVWTEYEAVDPTCDVDGNIAYKICECGQAWTLGENPMPLSRYGWVLGATGHTFVDVEAVEPTCNAEGNIAYQYCSVCGYAQTAGENPMPLSRYGWVLGATGEHTLEHHDAIEATCDQDGHEAFDYCSTCECFFYEDPLKLTYQAGIILATGHTWVEYEAVEPTCDMDGNIAYQQCSICGAAQTAGENPMPLAKYGWVLGATGHTWVDVAAVEPTCNAEGNIAYQYCSVCGAAQTAGENPMPLAKYGWVLAATGEHTLEHHDAVNASCTENGHEAFDYCSTCECFFYEDPMKLTYQAGIILATGHTYVEGTCSACGEADPDYVPEETTAPVVSSEATITFDDTSKRTEYDTDHQVWVENGITVTNNKAGSTSNVGDYKDPARFYKSSDVIIEYPGMTKIEIDCTGLADKYVSGWVDTFANAGITATNTDNIITAEFSEPTDIITLTSMTAQSRAYSITVYAGSGSVDPTEPEVTEPEVTEPVVLPSTPEEIVNAAYALASGETLEGTYTLTGVISAVNTAYSSTYGNITVTIVVGDMTDKPIMCYRMKGDGADVIGVSDTITVTGTLKNYNGTIEFDAGCTLDSYVLGDAPDENLTTPEEIVKAAYALEVGAALEKSYTLTGIITSIDSAYSASYGNITVTMVVGDMSEMPIKCYRLKGDGADIIGVGDQITVTGNIKNYNGTVEFDTGCTLDSYVLATPEVTEPEVTEPEVTEPEVPAELTTNIGELSFVAGEPMEFEFSTIANDYAGVLVIGTSNFSDESAIEKLEYYEVSNGQWYELTGDFGPATGFPMADATSLFRVTFAKGGEYTFTASMKDAATGEVLCSVEATANVHEHVWTEYEAVDPTCDVDGNIAYKICECGQAWTLGENPMPLSRYGWILGATGHTWVDVEAVAPTCHADGNIAYQYCSVCGAAQTAGENPMPLAKYGWILGAEHTALEHHDAVEATCDTDGHEAFDYCSDCQVFIYADPLKLSYQDGIILATGHAWVDVEAVAPTCHADGNIAYQYCSVCGAAQTAGENPMPLSKYGWVLAAEHTALEHHDAVEATCDQDGHEAFDYCSDCQVFIYADPLKLSFQDGVIPALGHSFVDYEAVEPTCDTDGNIAYQQCSVCGYAQTMGENPMPLSKFGWVLGATGHNWINVEAVEPSCNAEGNIAYQYCDICGAAQTAGENPMPLSKYGWVLAATGEHTFEHHDAIEATCDTDGHEAFDYCTTCECFFYEDPLKLTYQAGIILATGHTWVEHEAVEPTCFEAGNIAYAQCSVCGAAQTLGENPIPLSKDGWILGVKHNIVHVEAKEATIEAEGNVEYWYCADCGYAWLDEGLTQVTNLLSVILPKLPSDVKGDLNDDTVVTNDDVLVLLWHTLFPQYNPVEDDVDYTADGKVDNADVLKLLWYSLFPEDAPL